MSVTEGYQETACRTNRRHLGERDLCPQVRIIILVAEGVASADCFAHAVESSKNEVIHALVVIHNWLPFCF